MAKNIQVLVVGSGGREHAITWKLKQSRKVDRIFCAPGNGGMSQAAKCVNIKPDNIQSLVDFAKRNKINLTVVGPEQPLEMGIVDEFQRRKLKIFGPVKKAARIESSKVFAKEFMQKYHIPTSPFKVFDTPIEAIGFCKSVEYPIVIKADGLAAGKGVIIARTFKEATMVIDNMMIKKVFGKAGDRVVVESYLQGQEISVMAVTDGKTIVPLLSSQDHKQAYEGDKGPNTGGMGAYCPTSFLNEQLMEDVHDYVLKPAILGLRSEKITYCGILYAGLMLTDTGPKVLEFNCRFGDPETQVVLPLLKTDLADILTAVVDKKLGNLPKLQWRKGSTACVVMASKGYPGKYRTGYKISGLNSDRDESCFIFHSGTKREGNKWLTAGGRVLGVTGVDKNLQAALEKAYGNVKKIRFEGAIFRRDIGFRAFQPKRKRS